jgi:uncharacterized protein YgbK (DUF1537 family)
MSQAGEGPLRPVPGGNHLLVCGTTSERTKAQVSALAEAYRHEVIALDPGLLADPGRSEERVLESRFAQSALARNHGIVCIKPLQSHSWTGAQIVEGLGAFVASVLNKTRPASLFLTGGDTANAVLTAIGAVGLRLFGEVVPGMVQGAVLGGLFDGLPVVTKAGAFGGKGDLVALHEAQTREVLQPVRPDGTEWTS